MNKNNWNNLLLRSIYRQPLPYQIHWWLKGVCVCATMPVGKFPCVFYVIESTITLISVVFFQFWRSVASFHAEIQEARTCSLSKNAKSHPLADHHESNQMFDLILIKISANHELSVDVLFTMNLSLNFAYNRFRIEIPSKWFVTFHLDMIIPTSKQINQILLTFFYWTIIHYDWLC